MELTQEYFDQGLADLMEKMATVDDLKKLEAQMDKKLEHQTRELKQYTQQVFEIQQDWMDERLNELIVKYDVRERVGKLEKDVAKLKLIKSAS